MRLDAIASITLVPFLVHLITAIVAVAVALLLAAVRIFYEFNAPGLLGVLVLVGALAIWLMWKMAQLVGWTARKFNSRSQTLRNKMDKFPPAEDRHKRLEEVRLWLYAAGGLLLPNP